MSDDFLKKSEIKKIKEKILNKTESNFDASRNKKESEVKMKKREAILELIKKEKKQQAPNLFLRQLSVTWARFKHSRELAQERKIREKEILALNRAKAEEALKRKKEAQQEKIKIEKEKILALKKEQEINAQREKEAKLNLLKQAQEEEKKAQERRQVLALAEKQRLENLKKLEEEKITREFQLAKEKKENALKELKDRIKKQQETEERLKKEREQKEQAEKEKIEKEKQEKLIKEKQLQELKIKEKIQKEKEDAEIKKISSKLIKLDSFKNTETKKTNGFKFSFFNFKEKQPKQELPTKILSVSGEDKKEISKIHKAQDNEIKKIRVKDLKRNKLEISDILKTNLIKDDQTLTVHWRKNLAFSIFILIIPIIAIGFYYQQIQKDKVIAEDSGQQLSKEIDEAKREIALAQKESQEILDFQQKLDLAKNILDNHIYWTNFFKFLENSTISGVYYENFSGSTDGDYVLSANAPDFQVLAEQIKLMRKQEGVISVSSNGGSAVGRENPRIAFSLRLKINPKLFNIQK